MNWQKFKSLLSAGSDVTITPFALHELNKIEDVADYTRATHQMHLIDSRVVLKPKVLIPHPDNPHHVENLDSLEKLEFQGFAGPDLCLGISLGEYGIAWRYLDDGDILFIHHASHSINRFDRTSFRSDLDVLKEFSWVKPEDWASLLSSYDTTEAEWHSAPLTHKIQDLQSYYGVENIFGTSYWEGFAIEGIENR